MSRAKLARLCGLLLFVIAALWTLDGHVFFDAVAKLTMAGIAMSAVAVAITIFLGAIRWRVLLYVLGCRAGIDCVAAASSIGNTLNVLLPTGMIGDLVKVFLVGDREQLPVSELLGTVVVDRILGLIGFVFVAAVALLATDLPGSIRDSLALSPGLWGAAFIVAILVALLIVGLDRRLQRRAGWWRNILTTVSSLVKTVYGYRSQGPALLWSFLISVIAVLPVCLALWFLALPFARVPPGIVILAVTGSTLINLLPVTVNGLGSRDLVFVLVLGVGGVTREQAVALSLSWFAISLVVSVALSGLALVLFPNLVPVTRLRALVATRLRQPES